MLSFEKSQIRAATHCAAVKDVRFYLVGVLIEMTTSGDVHIVSTDGNILFAGLIPAPYVKWSGEPQKGPWSMIVPLDVIKRESKGPGRVELTAMSDGRYMLGASVFTPVDGRFPDWRRVSVSREVLDTRGEKPGQYDPALMVKCHEALKTWFDGGKFASYVHQHGDHAAVVTGDNMSAYCIVMPWRTRDLSEIRPFTPAPL